MARALCAWAINRGGKNSIRNLRYGPRTRLVRGMYVHFKLRFTFTFLFIPKKKESGRIQQLEPA